MTVSASIAALRPELWRKALFADVRDNLYMTRFIGDSEQSMIQELEDLKKEAGSNISFGLGMKLSGSGVTGDNTLEGSEEAMTDYDEDVAIDQLRHAVRLTGRMDEKKNAYDMRMSAKGRLTDWWAERLDQELLDKLCGKTTSTFANTPTAAAASRAIYAGGAASISAITTAMKMDTKVLDAAKQAAILASPRIRPVRVEGKQYYVAILHPYDATNLRQDPIWAQAQRDANVRSEENPIFSGERNQIRDGAEGDQIEEWSEVKRRRIGEAVFAPTFHERMGQLESQTHRTQFTKSRAGVPPAPFNRSDV